MSGRPKPIDYEQSHNLPTVHRHSNSEVYRFACATEVAKLEGPTLPCCTVTPELTGPSCYNETVVFELMTYDSQMTGFTAPAQEHVPRMDVWKEGEVIDFSGLTPVVDWRGSS